MMNRSIFCLIGVVAAVPASAQLTGSVLRGGCVGVAPEAALLTATGKLALRTFPGSPGFKSVAAGDEAERIFMLTLPHPVCIDDRGNLADPKQRFTTVQVYADEVLSRRLRRLIGRRVAVTGEGMPANTGHHRAPLVLTAKRVQPR